MSEIDLIAGAVENLRRDMVGGFRDIGSKFEKIAEIEANHDKRIDEAKRIADEAQVEAETAREENSAGLKALDGEGKKTRKVVGYGVLVILVSILTLVGVAAGFPGVREYITKLITGG